MKNGIVRTDLAVSLAHIFPMKQTQLSSLSFEAELAPQVWTGWLL